MPPIKRSNYVDNLLFSGAKKVAPPKPKSWGEKMVQAAKKQTATFEPIPRIVNPKWNQMLPSELLHELKQEIFIMMDTIETQGTWQWYLLQWIDKLYTSGLITKSQREYIRVKVKATLVKLRTF